jgi:hypothetical protein
MNRLVAVFYLAAGEILRDCEREWRESP